MNNENYGMFAGSRESFSSLMATQGMMQDEHKPRAIRGLYQVHRHEVPEEEYLDVHVTRQNNPPDSRAKLQYAEFLGQAKFDGYAVKHKREHIERVAYLENGQGDFDKQRDIQIINSSRGSHLNDIAPIRDDAMATRGQYNNAPYTTGHRTNPQHENGDKQYLDFARTNVHHKDHFPVNIPGASGTDNHPTRAPIINMNRQERVPNGMIQYTEDASHYPFLKPYHRVEQDMLFSMAGSNPLGLDPQMPSSRHDQALRSAGLDEYQAAGLMQPELSTSNPLLMDVARRRNVPHTIMGPSPLHAMYMQ